MHYLLLALIVVIAAALAARLLLSADPKTLARTIRTVGGGGLVVLAGLLAVLGRFAYALPLLLIGLGLMGKQLPFGLGGFNWPGGGQKSPGRRSRVRTSYLEMELDHDTGSVDGTVRRGPLQGRRLGELSLAELYDLYRDCESAGDQSAALLEAFLDRAHPDWRQGARAGAGAKGGSGRSRSRPGATDMSREEAYEVLGLKPGAEPDDIRKAHRALIKKYHPDQGGSTYLAAQINKAKQILLPDD